ncbi:putative acetyltransferase [Paractinoplanes abujensis]|uniref:RimJ/RimL family protein N-acetyltransferase n=1 Tax=Paractinoplanes abujensis TaxID=882441 RepID=A0A7W7G2S7_9ACTN|nr:GNAT family N-acetyltransferase [Actinoplanes abujensis]MBB4691946.1 RimJ/RimL family protein N-acetyltransferase [Actinoplanes abujensis]GID16635.1 putative acetyltransferase [Actinoplanes abujensis]
MSENVFPDVVLRTARLTLRPPREDDADAIAAAVADPETQRWLPLPSPYGREQAVTYVTGHVPAVRANGSGLIRAIESDGTLAGLIDLKKTDWRHRATEIGYWAAPAARARGLITEAVVALSRWALTEAALERVVLRIAPGNRASTRVAEKAGFTYEGVARNAGIVHAGRVDLAIYSLIPADLLTDRTRAPGR